MGRAEGWWGGRRGGGEGGGVVGRAEEVKGTLLQKELG